MDYLIRLEAAALLAIAPVLLAWLVGQRQGASRARIERAAVSMERPVVEHAAPDRRAAGDEVMSQSPASPLHLSGDANTPRNGAKKRKTPKRPKRVIDTLEVDYSDVEEIREYALSIRLAERIWDDPSALDEMQAADSNSVRVLREFRNSVSQLHGCNDDQREARAADNAPVSACTNVQGISERRPSHRA